MFLFSSGTIVASNVMENPPKNKWFPIRKKHVGICIIMNNELCRYPILE